MSSDSQKYFSVKNKFLFSKTISTTTFEKALHKIKLKSKQNRAYIFRMESLFWKKKERKKKCLKEGKREAIGNTLTNTLLGLVWFKFSFPFSTSK